MKILPTIFFFCFLTLISKTSSGQNKLNAGTFNTYGYYAGLKLVLKPDMTFTLKYRGHISSDTAAGTFKVKGDTISLKYDYNNYETIFASYKERNEKVPLDIQLAASRVGLRPKTLIKNRSGLYLVDKTRDDQPKTYDENGNKHFVYLFKAK
jgi:hypothetical protein